MKMPIKMEKTSTTNPATKLFSFSSYRSSSLSRAIIGDRFIPNRSSSNFALFNLNSTPSNSSSSDETSSAYTNLLRSAIFGVMVFSHFLLRNLFQTEDLEMEMVMVIICGRTLKFSRSRLRTGNHFIFFIRLRSTIGFLECVIALSRSPERSRGSEAV